MKAYAYPAGEPINDDGLLELDVVSLSADPKTVRAIAQFFMHVADEMDRMGEDYDHVHMQDASKAWKEEWPDIVVCKPNQ
jgi:hypothetical protein